MSGSEQERWCDARIDHRPGHNLRLFFGAFGNDIPMKVKVCQPILAIEISGVISWVPHNQTS